MRFRLATGLLALALTLSACGGNGGGSTATSADSSATSLDTELLALAKTRLGLTGDPASSRDVKQTEPDSDPLVKLGQLLFFSQTLSAAYDVSCATCHHPDFGASDGLSLAVGVAPADASVVGPGRAVDPLLDLDPGADGGPNMHRNSLTTFNAALFDRNMMYDGRVQVLDDATLPGGHGQAIQTPESGQREDVQALDGLMEFTVKGPIVNDNEMRGFLYTQYATGAEYREHLVRRLRGEEDLLNNRNPEGPANWLERFRAAFDQPTATAASIITADNVQRALGAYVDSQIFIDSPWHRYLDGEETALSESAKRGALLFLQPIEDGGLGCAACHAGDRFTDESFHNLGFPQIGRGFIRADGTDLGRWITSRQGADMYAFRTPSLLNAAETGPFGHDGTFASLQAAIRYHVDPRRAVDTFDFSLSNLAQFRNAGVVYPDAEANTRAAIAADSFTAAEAQLPRHALTTTEELDLVYFIIALTDRCVADQACISRWTPSSDEDPDGNMLVRDQSSTTGISIPKDYPESISLVFPDTVPRATFAEIADTSCGDGPVTQNNTGDAVFLRRNDPSFGLGDQHAYSYRTWFEVPSLLEVAMIGGGVSAGYLTDDCWPDLIFTSGAVAGMIVYENLGSSFRQTALLEGLAEQEFTGTAIADLNGDYRRELVLGNVRAGQAPILAQDGSGHYVKIADLPTVRPTFGISFAPLDSSGFPYLYLGHWSGGSGSDDGSSPALWKNDGTAVAPWDVAARTTSEYVDQRFNFTPKFADVTGDGLTDLVIASDFLTSETLRNVDQSGDSPLFENDTDREVITDENGMGSALLDIDNDGNLEWFVTSIFQDSSRPPEGNWGQSGNRLYRNLSTADKIVFEDITTEAGVRDGYWGWGACAADVNNDGFIDLFHVNGFGYIPDDVVTDSLAQSNQERFTRLTPDFVGQPSRLFINDGDGTFTEEAASWGIDAPSEGRGIACFDYDRDGDIDIAVFSHSSDLQFFDNQSGSGPGRRFVSIRLVGEAPNTDAIGARVYVTADVLGGGAAPQRQLRLSEANSNFNSQNPPDLHFGLGQAGLVDEIRVVWPDQTETVCVDVPVNRFLVIDQRVGCPAGL